MPQALLAGLFFAHGLITTAIGLPAVTRGGDDLPNPGWLGWWPTNLGRSWLLDAVQFGPGGYALGGLLWLASGLAFAGAGLGLFGVPRLRGLWQPLALAGGGCGLVAAALFLHPWYAFAVLINLAVVITQAGTRGPLTVATG
jgi:hypothetical protein